MDLERKRIGIFLTYNKIALGEIIYIINLIKSISAVEEQSKPSIVLFYDEDNHRFVQEIMQINYPFIEYHIFNNHRNKLKVYLKSFLALNNLFIDNIHKRFNLNALFAINDFPFKPINSTCLFISWIPDFQHKFYPQYFSIANRIFRNLRFKRVAQKTDFLILSSNNAREHFCSFYDKQRRVKTKVLQFNSLIDEEYNYLNADVLLKYKITQPYFIVCNQFYEHKNHLLVFKALHYLNLKGIFCKIVFTGRMEDYRNPSFIKNLKQYINNYNIESNCIFLGVIPRNEQLSLMKQSLAVLQPSKFEGWSTVIEDAKSLGVPVLASGIAVHEEQLNNNAYYFGIDDHAELALLLQGYLNKSIMNKPAYTNYKERVQNFANQFLEVIN